ncbi:MAG: hypothetical protein QM764_15965 [Chitinophagaceae bacterium]
MLKRLSLMVLLIAGGYVLKAQEIGYTTTDFGAEAAWQSSGGVTGMVHLAFNAAIHSGFQIRAGYNVVNRESWGNGHASEKGGGSGAGIGYRYYFPFRPHQFFLGLRADVWRLNLDWKDASSFGTTKTLTIHPAAEMGYMFLVNDMVFITPAVSAGYLSNISTDGEPVGEGFVFTAGMSVGVKF